MKISQRGLFDFSLVFLTQDIEGPSLDGCKCSWNLIDAKEAEFPLSLEFFFKKKDAHFLITYQDSPSLKKVSHRLISFFLYLAEHLNPDTRVGDLDVLTDADRDNITTWSVGEELDIPAGVTLDSLLVDQAHATPTATALIDDATGTELSYAQFTARVNALAGLLADRGVDVGDRVAVAVHRSLDLPVVLAAIIRAGGIYVPVDPEYPAERVSYILADAAPVLLVTDADTTTTHREVFTTTGVPVVSIDDPAVQSVLATGVSTPPVLSRPLTPADGAYVIYTSGTTGRPKGVAITHPAITNRLHWGAGTLSLSPNSIMVSKSGIGFVDAATELFTPLVTGATVVTVDNTTAKDPARLLDCISRHHLTHLLTVPSLADTLCEQDTATTTLDSLQHWYVSGERLTSPTATRIHNHAPDAVVHNFYGSTEVTGDATTAQVDSTDTPIGSPVANTTAHVLDSWLRPVAPGVIGELYLGGAQLADGYVNRHGLTAERFIADPFTDDGNRLYRTGDLVSWNQDGHLDYHGRADDQVKIRGNRIEPDEIRAVVEQHPKVTAAAVIACDHPAGGKFLAAYLTGADLTGDGDITATIRDWVADRLPDYMVPTTVTVLDVLPTTTNGKLDRRALPTPDLGAGSGTGRAPATDTEKTIAAVFTDVLALDDDTELSIDDDFFHLGGHSLLANRVVASLLKSGFTIRIRDIFENPTIGGLASSLDQTSVEEDPAEEPAALAPTPALETLRESGDDPNTWIYTDVVSLEPGTSKEILEKQLWYILTSTPALRLRVTPTSRRLWSSEILPVAALTKEQADMATATSLDGARKMAGALVDVTTGHTIAAAVVDSGTSVSLVVCAHAAAVDRLSLHRIATQLASPAEAGETGTSAEDHTSTLVDIFSALEAAGDDPDAPALAELTTHFGSAKDAADSHFATGTSHRFITEVEINELYNALSTVFGTGVAVHRELSLTDGTGALVAGPLTATVPHLLGDEWDAERGHTFTVLRHYDRRGRRTLRTLRTPQILVTEEPGQPAADNLPEGPETRYRGVIRITGRTGAGDQRVVTLLGFAEETTHKLRKQLRGEEIST